MQGTQRRGRLSKKDQKFIRDNFGTLSAEEIAEKINKTAEGVEKYISFNNLLPAKDRREVAIVREVAVDSAIEYAFKNSADWPQLRQQFTKTELDLFVSKYAQYVSQFNNDVLPTERTQIMIAIKLEILLDRNMRDKKVFLEDIEKARERADKLYSKGFEKLDVHEKKLLNTLESEISALNSARSSLTSEIDKNLDKHAKVMRELKGTRDQRIKNIENSKKSWIDLIKALQEDEKFRQREGRYMQLMKIAEEKSHKKLGQDHRYMDGQFDKPILSAETINEEAEAEEEKIHDNSGSTGKG